MAESTESTHSGGFCKNLGGPFFQLNAAQISSANFEMLWLLFTLLPVPMGCQIPPIPAPPFPYSPIQPTNALNPLYVPIGTVIVAEQQLATTTPAPANPNSELVDQIESIDVGSAQLVVQTTRQGPPDSARVAIEVVDLATGDELPPMNLTGILLVLTRGRYTVNWLRPNRWYGVWFRAEQHYAGGTAVYANEEAHLVKTHRADGSHEEGRPLVTVRTQRNGEGGRSLENLVLTVRWEQHPEERPNLDALANITLFCAEHIKYKQLRLRGRDIDKSVEIRLDNQFEVHEQRNGTARQMHASIRPKHCPRICWNAELVAEGTRGRTFRRAATHSCEQIEPVGASTTLRDFVGYELVPGADLVIHTNFTEPDGGDAEEQDAYVQLTAIAVPEARKADNSTIRYKTFATRKHGTEFVLDHLEPGKLYAVQYTYGKQSPFAYEESRRFLVDTGAQLEPVHVEMELIGVDSVQPGVSAVARLDERFKSYELGVDVEPVCELGEQTLHFWLDADKREKALRELRLVDSLCTATPAHSLCRAPGNAAEIRGCGIRDGRLCYTANIVVHQKLFSADRRCVQLAQAVPPMPSTTASTTTTTPQSTSAPSPPSSPTSSSVPPRGTTATTELASTPQIGRKIVPPILPGAQNGTQGRNGAPARGSLTPFPPISLALLFVFVDHFFG